MISVKTCLEAGICWWPWAIDEIVLQMEVRCIAVSMVSRLARLSCRCCDNKHRSLDDRLIVAICCVHSMVALI